MILVAGGTGQLGGIVVRQFLGAGEPIRVLARNPTKPAPGCGGADMIKGDVRDRAAVDRAVTGVSVVVCAMTGFGPRGAGSRAVDYDGAVNLIEAAEAEGVEHFVLLSVNGASADHPIELFRMKHLAELRVRQSKLAWTILRPTAFMQTWATVACAPLLEKGRTVLFGQGLNPINFISVHDVARFVGLALADPALRGEALDLGGPENLTMTDLVGTFSEVTGAHGRIGHVPLPLMRVMSGLLRPFKPAIAQMMRAAVVMDTVDMTFDATTLQRRFPNMPLTTACDAFRYDFAGRTPALD